MNKFKPGDKVRYVNPSVESGLQNRGFALGTVFEVAATNTVAGGRLSGRPAIRLTNPGTGTSSFWLEEAFEAAVPETVIVAVNISIDGWMKPHAVTYCNYATPGEKGIDIVACLRQLADQVERERATAGYLPIPKES